MRHDVSGRDGVVGQRVGMRQDLVDVADIFPARGVRIVTRQAAARRPAAAQRRDAVNAASRERPVAPRFPTHEAPGLPRQIVQRASERGEPPAKTARIKGSSGRGGRQAGTAGRSVTPAMEILGMPAAGCHRRRRRHRGSGSSSGKESGRERLWRKRDGPDGPEPARRA